MNSPDDLSTPPAAAAKAARPTGRRLALAAVALAAAGAGALFSARRLALDEPDTTVFGTAAFQLRMAVHWRWPRCAAARCWSTSGPRGARPVSRNCRY